MGSGLISFIASTVIVDKVKSPAARIINISRDTILASEGRVALSVRERTRGLIGRDPMGPGEALIIPRCRQVHTFGMVFPIDILFVDGDGVAVGFRRDMPPRRISRIACRARCAIELPAGTLERTGTASGDVIQIEETASDGRV